MSHSPAHTDGGSLDVLFCGGVTSHSVMRAASMSKQAFTSCFRCKLGSQDGVASLLCYQHASIALLVVVNS